MSSILALLPVIFLAQSPAMPFPEGYWEGTAGGGPAGVRVSLDVVQSGRETLASYGIPGMGLEGIPLSGLVVDRDAGTLTAPHQLSARLQSGKLVGTLSPLWAHGPPVAFELVAAPRPSPVASERSVRFTSQGITLAGTLVAPLHRGRRPAMVSLHGSGPSTRWAALGRARHFAQAGYVTLLYDKRGSGESGGDWTKMSLDDAAIEALDALEFLRRQPEVDPTRIGLWGHSQAGWVISRAAAMGRRIDFVMVLAGGASPPAAVERHGYRAALRHAGIGDADAARAMALVEEYLEYLRSGKGYDALSATLRKQADQPWLRALGLARVLPTPEWRASWEWVSTYEPASDIARMRMPVLLMFAGKDASTPPDSLDLWRRSLRAAENPRVEAQVFPDGDHHFRVRREGAALSGLARGYLEIQVDWLARNVDARQAR